MRGKRYRTSGRRYCAGSQSTGHGLVTTSWGRQDGHPIMHEVHTAQQTLLFQKLQGPCKSFPGHGRVGPSDPMHERC